MKRRRPNDEPLESGAPPAALTLSKAEVRRMVSQEVHAAVEKSDKMMMALMERIQEIDSEPKYDARIRKLGAHVKKVKRRGDSAFAFIRKELRQNKQSPQILMSVAEMGNLSSANGGCSGGSTSASAEIDCEGEAVRKPKEGFWQRLRSKKEIVDLTDEGEVCRQNGERHSDSPLMVQLPMLKQEDLTPTEQSKSSCPVPHENKKSSVEEARAALQSRLPAFPDTPFPHQLPVVAATKNLPQKPVVKVARIDNPQGIALLWNVEEEDPHAPDMESYYIYVIQEYQDGTFSKWKTMGVIKAMTLPMACRVSDRSGGKTLHFIIIGKDIYGRYGPYSDVQTVSCSKT
ncbi:activating transcription factor 7-interacting protein 2 isoform X2 [Salminus brasiliensis]|uniref:activating transcription factor 7-interacting protein 2 isoform X2 n=1 Tax=Salminus brasiliensis TaxID=930266 RepID=UPI003B82D6D2